MNPRALQAAEHQSPNSASPAPPAKSSGRAPRNKHSWSGAFLLLCPHRTCSHLRFKVCPAQCLLQLWGRVKDLHRAQINRRWGGASGTEGGRQAHPVHLFRNSQVPNEIIWEITQLIFKLLQKQLLKISPSKIKTLLQSKTCSSGSCKQDPKHKLHWWTQSQGNL